MKTSILEVMMFPIWMYDNDIAPLTEMLHCCASLGVGVIANMQEAARIFGV